MEDEEEVPCKTDPRAPHGFLRNASHTLGRYVCECEYWSAPEKNLPLYDWEKSYWEEESAGYGTD